MTADMFVEKEARVTYWVKGRVFTKELEPQWKGKWKGHELFSSGSYEPSGSHCSVKVGGTGRKSCQWYLMRAAVTDVGHLAALRVQREQVNAGQGRLGNTPLAPSLTS